VLVTVDGTSAVQAWASLDLGAQEVNLFSGMTADVEIVTAETRDALLVPVQALRETSAGEYTVFVVTSDGELEMRTVVVGLMDPVNAEVLDGLELGDIVSIGEAE
jgi:multidrug efflux pump subunit AcrA (membrane-fusion protein)